MFKSHSQKASRKKKVQNKLARVATESRSAQSGNVREEIARIAQVIDANNAVFKDALHNTEMWLSILRMSMQDMVGGLLKTKVRVDGVTDLDYEHYITKYRATLAEMETAEQAAEEAAQTAKEVAEGAADENDPSVFIFGGGT